MSPKEVKYVLGIWSVLIFLDVAYNQIKPDFSGLTYQQKVVKMAERSRSFSLCSNISYRVRDDGDGVTTSNDIFVIDDSHWTYDSFEYDPITGEFRRAFDYNRPGRSRGPLIQVNQEEISDMVWRAWYSLDPGRCPR